MNTQDTMNAGSLVTFQDEFVGRRFLGKGSRDKGEFVSARWVHRMRPRGGAGWVEVTFRTSDGALDVTDFRPGTVLRFG